MAILAGWGLNYAASQKDRWFRRILYVEGLFLLVFTQWYFSRYLQIGPKLAFGVMIGLILGGSLLILGGGVIWDLIQKKKMTP
jgi:hypothetical protein